MRKQKERLTEGKIKINEWREALIDIDLGIWIDREMVR
jgi:hypothetical protein